MFKKVQLKFFGIIVGILIAVFIAILGSINLIMNSMMERQSMTVLKKIAAGVEYDEKTSTFTFKVDEKPPEMRKKDDVPQKPDKQPDTEEITSEQQTAAETASEISTTVTTAEPEEIFDDEETEEEQPENDEETSPPPVQQEEQAPEPPQKPDENKEPLKPENHHEKQDEKPDEHENHEGHDNDRDNQWWSGEPDPWRNPWWGGENPPETPPPPSWGFPWWGFGSNYSAQEPSADENEESTQTFRTAEELYSGIMPLVETLPQLQEKEGFRREFRDNREMREPVPKSLGSIDFFIVMSDKQGKYLSTLNNDDLSEENAQKFITAISEKGITNGMLNNYQFYSAFKDNGRLFVFTDKTTEIDMLKKLRRTTVIIGILSIILISMASYFLSGLIVKPLKETFDKQKQFISDASHELKTPLTVISTNADVLSGEIGENKWLTYIQDQTIKMNVLVNELLNLTRLENNTSGFMRVDFDLSKAVENTALPFECQAFEMDKKLILDIDEGININGSEQHIKQMTAIFIDNALKYSDDHGTVKVSLTKEGDKKILSVFNTGNGIREYEKNRIFERFYRGDESRNRSSGSYGLGLAIAKTIIDKHKFRIHIENEEGKYIRFVITMT